jgi:glycosyltransferase involved in cell wall biosynthesis
LESQFEAARMKVAFYAGAARRMTGGPQVLASLLTHLPLPADRKLVLARAPGPISQLSTGLGCPTFIIGGLDRYGESLQAKTGARRLELLLILMDLLRFGLKLQRVLRRERPNVLWVRNIKGVVAVAAPAWLSQTPLVWDVGMEPRSTGIVRWLHEMGFRLAHFVVAEGPSVFEQAFPPSLAVRFRDKQRVIPSGLDPAKARRLERAAARTAGDGEFVMLCVGTVCRRKNQEMLLRAAEPILDRYPHVSVLVVGAETEPDYAAALKARYARRIDAGRIRFLGWRDDVPEIMGKAHVLAHVSTNEGVPYVVLEAFHSGLPVVATRAGGVPDVLIDGVSGYLVEGGDVTRLTERLIACVERPDMRARLAAGGRTVIRERYSLDRWIAGYYQLFSEVAR